MSSDSQIDSLFDNALDVTGDEGALWAAIMQLQNHATQLVFDRVANSCRAHDPRVRARCLDILGQLRVSPGAEGHAFPEQTFDLVTSFLNEEQDPGVISSALVALGHIGMAQAVNYCVRFVPNPNAEIRFSVSFALSRFPNDPLAIHWLMHLMKDEEAKVRDWSTFGLGILSESDSPQIREALFQNTTDADVNTREEAICGLARRKDERMIPILKGLLQHQEVSSRILEAAEFLSIASS